MTLPSERESRSLDSWARMAYTPDHFDSTDLLALIRSGARVLDLGCSTGNITLEMAARGAIVTGVDLSEERVGVARRDAARKGLASRSTFIAGDFTDAGFAATLGVFDLVTAIRSLTCVVELERLAAGVSSVLRLVAPGGLVWLSDFSYDPNNAVYTARYEDGKRRGYPAGSFDSHGLDGSPFVAHHFRREEIESYFRAFTALRFRTYPGLSLNGNRCTMFDFVGRNDGDGALSSKTSAELDRE